MSSSQTRHEYYARQEPDGRVVTTTSRNAKYTERVYGCGPGSVDDRYCCQPEGILRIVEIIVALVIISLITSVFGPGPFKGILFGQTILMLFAGIAICLTFIFLLVYFLNLHETHLKFWPWVSSDFAFSCIASVSFLVLGIVEAYYSTGTWANNCNDIGGDGCRMIFEWVFASFFCFVNAIFYAFSALLVNRSRYETRQNY